MFRSVRVGFLKINRINPKCLIFNWERNNLPVKSLGRCNRHFTRLFTLNAPWYFLDFALGSSMVDIGILLHDKNTAL